MGVHRREVEIDDRTPIDLTSPESVQQASPGELATTLMKEVFLRAVGETVSRRAELRGFGHHLAPQQREPHLRRLAEAWQRLESTGLVCEDVEDSRGDWWFLTSLGRGVLSSSALGDEIAVRAGPR